MVDCPPTLNPQPSILFFRLARFFALLAGLTGLLTLGEYIFGWNLGIDQMLFVESAGTVGTSHPGRMAPETALNFIFLSVALWITGGPRKTRWTVYTSVPLGLLVAAFALAALLSYLMPGLGAYGWFGLTIMAVHTAILFALLGLAVMANGWQPEVLSWSLSRRTTAAFACGLALLVFIGLNTNRSQFWMKETNRQIAHNEKMQGNIEGLQAEVIDVHVHTRDYLITGDERLLKFYLLAKADSDAKLDALRQDELASADPAHLQHLTQIDAQVKAQFQWMQQMIDARRTGMADAVRNNMIGHAQDFLNGLRTTLSQAKNDHHQITRRLKQESESVSQFSYLTTFIGTLVSLLIFLSVIFRLNSAVNERKQAAEDLRISALNHQMLFENSHDALMTLAPPSWKFTGANQATLQLFGASSVAEFTALGPWDVAPERQPDGRPSSEKAQEMIATALREGSHFFEWVHQRLDGQPFATDVLLTRMVVGEKLFLQATVRDITERKQVEAKLVESERHFRAVTESANDAIITAVGAGTIVVWNAAAERVFGYAEAEIIGKPIAVLMPERFRKPHSEGLARVAAGGAPHLIGKTVEVFGLRKDGSEFPLEISLAQWQAAEDQFFTAIIRDITERKLAEAKQTEQIEELRRWHEATSGREGRILELKHEVNELLGQAGQPPRYPSAE